MYTGLDTNINTLYMQNWVVDSTSALIHDMDNMSCTLKVITDASPEYSFKLELLSETGRRDILDMERTENTLVVTMTNSALPKPGIYTLQIRGTIIEDGEVITRHTNSFYMRVRQSIGAAAYYSQPCPPGPHPGHRPPQPGFPTEFILLENRLYELKNEAVLAAERSEQALKEMIELMESGATADKCCTYEQSEPATVWVINHCLAKMPAVTVISSTGELVVGEITYLNADTLEIRFTDPISGIAYLN